MDVSVIIPAYNEAKHVAACVRSVRDAIASVTRQRPGVRWRTIVVDNNSTDATARLARDAGADRVVFEPVNHIARARNAGAADAMSRVGADASHWLVFMDADSRLPAALLADVLAAADSGACVGGASTIRFDPPTTWLTPIEPLMNWIMSLLKITPGAFIFARADAFDEIHGFNTTLFAAEDARIGADLKRWGKARGLRLVILNGNPVLTSPRKSSLYRPHEMATLCLRVLFSPATLKSRARLGIFYDGRR
jgi:glycosyltransferase involved in cell wall biosynthesis